MDVKDKIFKLLIIACIVLVVIVGCVSQNLTDLHRQNDLLTNQVKDYEEQVLLYESQISNYEKRLEYYANNDVSDEYQKLLVDFENLNVRINELEVLNNSYVSDLSNVNGYCNDLIVRLNQIENEYLLLKNDYEELLSTIDSEVSYVDFNVSCYFNGLFRSAPGVTLKSPYSDIVSDSGVVLDSSLSNRLPGYTYRWSYTNNQIENGCYFGLYIDGVFVESKMFIYNVSNSFEFEITESMSEVAIYCSLTDDFSENLVDMI